jgi:DNA-binding Xre family transcriptional regulator
MPTYIDIEPALLRWQAKYNRRLTYDELADMAGISIAALYRMKSGDMIAPDLRKINQLCKILECEPGEIIVREQTKQVNEATSLEVERREILNEMARKVQQRKKSSV